MNAREALASARQRLSEVENGGNHAVWLFEEAFGISYLQALQQQLDPDALGRYFGMVDRRAAGEPVQYIIGHWPFLGAEFSVGSGVLIPRPETEEVASLAISRARESGAKDILDLCAGTGCIGISIARALPGARVSCVELYPKAFKYLERNIAALAPGVAAVMADALEYHEKLAPGSIDMLVSNPPYVSREEMASLQPELAHEPVSALEAADGGLLFYKTISACYLQKLRPGGRLIFEIGHRQGDQVVRLLEGLGYCDVQLLLDQGGNPRIVEARVRE